MMSLASLFGVVVPPPGRIVPLTIEYLTWYRGLGGNLDWESREDLPEMPSIECRLRYGRTEDHLAISSPME